MDERPDDDAAHPLYPAGATIGSSPTSVPRLTFPAAGLEPAAPRQTPWWAYSAAGAALAAAGRECSKAMAGDVGGRLAGHSILWSC